LLAIANLFAGNQIIHGDIGAVSLWMDQILAALARRDTCLDQRCIN
jgi:hypothetical protein